MQRQDLQIGKDYLLSLAFFLEIKMYRQPLTALKGVGEKKAAKLKRIGLETFGDVLTDYPRRYMDRRVVKHASEFDGDTPGVIKAKVVRKRKKVLQKSKGDLLILDVTDGFYTGEILFFSAKFLEHQFEESESYFFYGKLEKNGPSFKMVQPDFAISSDASFLRIIPVYNATLGITQNELIGLHKQVLTALKDKIIDPLPEMIRHMGRLMPYEQAVFEIHFPTSEVGYKAAKQRLVYDELFFLQMRLILLKRNYHKPNRKPFEIDDRIQKLIDTLPFKLTQAQRAVMDTIFEDFKSGFSMNRLIQGDVGSGKTIIAFLALMCAVFNDKQGILLAPTTLLAEQHYENFMKMFPDVPCALLTSHGKASDKRLLKQQIESHEVKIVIGTHAVLQEDVKFDALGVVITDEQHRFGIRQRLTALQKSENPHALIMSATPIPRTLSLILYGDMDISIIDEMPAGRKPIKTHFVKPSKVDEMHDFIESKLVEGRQAYVICPLIEASETLDLNAAQTLYETLCQRFQHHTVGLIHGKMSAQNKEDAMQAFKQGKTQLLVSTTVIEVGIHVSNATMMVIMNTERFGLSQLHQLRGRVGRGDEQSYCFLLSDKLSKTAKMRVETLVASNNGFEVAEKDLELRGPGEVFGLRQHGIPELKLANLSKHKAVIGTVQKHIKNLLEEFQLGHPEAVTFIKSQQIDLEKWFTL